MNTNSSLPGKELNQLSLDWNQLSDLGRAEALAAIKQTGVSTRQIARHLDKSEALLRRLLNVLDAPAADWAAARKGQLSTNELVRRAKAESARKSAQREKDLKRDKERQVLNGTKLICDWLRHEQVYGPDGERIIGEVRRELAMREQNGSLPKHPEHIELEIMELISRSKPKSPRDDNAGSNTWFAEWLCRWAFYAFPDSDIRNKALELALGKQWKR